MPDDGPMWPKHVDEFTRYSRQVMFQPMGPEAALKSVSCVYQLTDISYADVNYSETS
jgi:hypothetical protein